MAVGQAGLGGGHREFAGVVNGLQDREKLLIELLPRFVADQPGGTHQDLAHLCPTYALMFILCDRSSGASFCPLKNSILVRICNFMHKKLSKNLGETAGTVRARNPRRGW